MSTPLKQYRFGVLGLSVFENSTTRDGMPSSWLETVLSRRFKDPVTGEWKSTSVSLTPSEIPIVIRLLQIGHDDVLIAESGEPSEDLIARLGGSRKATRSSRRNGAAASPGGPAPRSNVVPKALEQPLPPRPPAVLPTAAPLK